MLALNTIFDDEDQFFALALPNSDLDIRLTGFYRRSYASYLEWLLDQF